MSDRGMARLLSPKELAEVLGVPVDTVYAWNSRGSGPKRYQVGKHVRYRLSDVDKWLNDRAVEDDRTV